MFHAKENELQVHALPDLRIILRVDCEEDSVCAILLPRRSPGVEQLLAARPCDGLRIALERLRESNLEAVISGKIQVGAGFGGHWEARG